MSASGLELNQENDTSNQSIVLPDYSTCLLLVFKFVAMVIVLLMAGLVIATIKTTRSLHRSHVIFISHVMITSMILAIVRCF